MYDGFGQTRSKTVQTGSGAALLVGQSIMYRQRNILTAKVNYLILCFYHDFIDDAFKCKFK